jgi:hypothetical protein
VAGTCNVLAGWGTAFGVVWREGRDYQRGQLVSGRWAPPCGCVMTPRRGRWCCALEHEWSDEVQADDPIALDRLSAHGVKVKRSR